MRKLAGIVSENEPYHKESLIKSYSDYNASVLNYFLHRPQDLLVLNVSDKGAFNKLCDFLGKETINQDFPWENKT